MKISPSFGKKITRKIKNHKKKTITHKIEIIKRSRTQFSKYFAPRFPQMNKYATRYRIYLVFRNRLHLAKSSRMTPLRFL